MIGRGVSCDPAKLCVETRFAQEARLEHDVGDGKIGGLQKQDRMLHSPEIDVARYILAGHAVHR